MPPFINVDSIELEVVNGFPGPPGSQFRLPTGKMFGFPWKPDQLYRIGGWIVGVSVSDRPGRAKYIAHDLESGGTIWNADVDAAARFTMDLDRHGFIAGTTRAKFDRSITQVLEFGDGFWVVLDVNASQVRGENIAFVASSGHTSWVTSDSPGGVAPYIDVRVNRDGFIEAWHDRYMAVIDPATLRIIATRP